jgi:prolyl-tRNA synthetase
VLADSGEDAIVFSTESEFAANIEKAEALPSSPSDNQASQQKQEIATPNTRSIEEVCAQLSVDPSQTVKTLIVSVEDEENKKTLYALVVRGDHELNEVKAQKILGMDTELTFASEQQIVDQLNCPAGSLGPVDLGIPLIVDHSAAALTDFVCGANREGFHLTGVNWQTDCSIETQGDIRNVVAGDPSPDGKGILEIKRGIEVGHIFQLGTKYSEAMKATVLNEQGKEQAMTMGCYGIGVSRIVAAAIEQNHDENGIIWPAAIAPFQIALVPINMHKSDRVKQTCESLYSELTEAGFDVLFMDEQKARLGSMLADIELIGIPHRLVIGERGLDEGKIEYRDRTETENQHIEVETLMAFIADKLGD